MMWVFHKREHVPLCPLIVCTFSVKRIRIDRMLESQKILRKGSGNIMASSLGVPSTRAGFFLLTIPGQWYAPFTGFLPITCVDPLNGGCTGTPGGPCFEASKEESGLYKLCFLGSPNFQISTFAFLCIQNFDICIGSKNVKSTTGASAASTSRSSSPTQKMVCGKQRNRRVFGQFFF